MGKKHLYTFQINYRQFLKVTMRLSRLIMGAIVRAVNVSFFCLIGCYLFWSVGVSQ